MFSIRDLNINPYFIVDGFLRILCSMNRLCRISFTSMRVARTSIVPFDEMSDLAHPTSIREWV